MSWFRQATFKSHIRKPCGKIGEKAVPLLNITRAWRWHYYVNRIKLNGMHSGWNFNGQIEWIKLLSTLLWNIAPFFFCIFFLCVRVFVAVVTVCLTMPYWLVSLLTLIPKFSLKNERCNGSRLPFHRCNNNLTDIYWLLFGHSIKLGPRFGHNALIVFNFNAMMNINRNP